MKPPQSAAIPYRRTAAHELEVLLITSRRKGRWVLPKGKVRRMLPQASAAREAFEEAGVLGVIAHQPVGTYRQLKALSSGGEIEIAVSAYPLFVNTVLRKWPEMAFRQRQWMHAVEAAELVDGAELRVLLQGFAARYWEHDPPS